MPLYETVFIARQDLTPDDVNNLSKKYEKIINDGQGKVVSKEYWGLRSFAYKIKKFSRGHYVLLNIDAEVAAVKELERVIGFDESVIRSFTFKTERHEDKTALFVAQDAVAPSEKEVKGRKGDKGDKDQPLSELDQKIAKVRIEV